MLTYVPMCLYKYFKRVKISATSLPDPKGPLSDHLQYLQHRLNAEAYKEILKAVAEAKEPQKKCPYIKFTLEYKAKVAS